MRKTEIVPWTEQWEEQYRLISPQIEAVLGTELVEIHHVGSTSVPTIGYAKPIIDVLAIVHDIEKVDVLNEQMINIGFTPKGENGLPSRRYFTKGGDERTHHLHVYQLGHPQIRTYLDFKAYALAHPEEARAYGELKTRLAKEFPDDVSLYQQGKADFVQAMVDLATEWARQQDGAETGKNA